MEIKYLEIDEVYNIHEKMLKVGGGRFGIRDFTLIHSAVERPKASFAGRMLYHDIWFQAAALIQSLIKNHPFEDGNGRIARVLTDMVLAQDEGLPMRVYREM